MPVVATDIIVYGSANMQETDVGTQGGAIDLTTTIVFTDLTANTTITAVSDAVGDNTQTLTITGRIPDGSIVTEILSLTDTTPVAGATTFERILKMVLSGVGAGTITITESTGGATIAAIAAGVLTVRRPFYNASADASGGAARTFYEKVFFYNSNATSALTSATIEELAGGVATSVDFDLESALDGANTSTDRTTAPTGQTFSSTIKNVANTQNHSPVSGQGVWLLLSLAAGTAASNSTYSLRESGQTV